jgi:hypothetical protein
MYAEHPGCSQTYEYVSPFFLRTRSQRISKSGYVSRNVPSGLVKVFSVALDESVCLLTAFWAHTAPARTNTPIAVAAFMRMFLQQLVLALANIL